MYGTTFVDGGVLDGIPSDIAKEYNPKIIIAVSIMAFDTVVQLKNYTSVFIRAYTVASHNLTKEKLTCADIIIAPDLKGLPLMSGKENEKMYKLGIAATEESLPKIKKLLHEKGIHIKKN